MIYEPHVADARSRMEEVGWEAAFAEGRSMGLEAAVEYALFEEDPVTPSSPAQQRRSVGRRPIVLTSREEEIAALVARGLTNRRIAKELSISEHTAATHIRRNLK